jgi:hypothetical protein
MARLAASCRACSARTRARTSARAVASIALGVASSRPMAASWPASQAGGERGQAEREHGGSRAEPPPAEPFMGGWSTCADHILTARSAYP